MSKRKNAFQISKINRRKKSQEPGFLRKVKHWIHQYDQHFRHAALVILVILASLFVYYFQQTGGYLFKASVLEAPTPFTGTVSPVDKVPDWTNWGGNNNTTIYSSVSANLLVALPSYDLQQMQFPDTNLQWGNSSHDKIRNAKITYPVVYLGNYQLDHQEYSGSHPAVDIKMPIGTPIKSIANGRVVKVSMQNSGFGHHVVIEHRNVPDISDPNKKVTIYSAYNHMDEIHVSEGQTVGKGQLIGTSGDTGTATTPHLHFQIDRDTAPWHPYWPFTSAESQTAGLSFFEAVNAGLGLSNAKQYTINPMLYVSKYLNYSGSNVDSGADDFADDNNGVSGNDSQQDGKKNTEKNPPDTNKKPVEETTVEVVQPGNESSKVDTSLFAFSITGESVSMINNGVTITATDKLGQIARMSDNDEVPVNVYGVGRLSKKSFRKADFKNNSIQFIVNSSETGTAKVEVGKTVHEVGFIEQVQPVSSLRVESDGNHQKGQVEVIKLVALDQDGSPTPVVNFSGSINVTTKQGHAEFTPNQLSANDFRNGVAEIRMISQTEDPIVIRAQNGAIVGISDTIYREDRQQFADVNKSHANYEAIKYLQEQGIISGYSDGTFKPGNTVNRAEALKMLMLAFDLQAGPGGALPFSDTDDSAWYAGTLATALEKAIVKGYDDGTFRPANTVNKAEYLKMIFLTGGISPGENLAANPYNDVPKDAWYAPYAYLTNKMNLLSVSNDRLSAGSGMTRGDVAETIYRLKYIQDHNLVTYQN
ncbi:S-layer homology domain-containing protein [Patescibacteria group bacterium]|nr:S-layer homology domain-containing protein [Patescibacteria group bacterium]MBU1016336.1 S-layer homology domain-containing protein [Patescibacteria group bacterium]MBU1685039.1 S-layer homology domain-containing protein [Patescibacteria group bacterium]MBU1938847.1 S-layer homology domain-containing protein [Patescibacteria group bacterium]